MSTLTPVFCLLIFLIPLILSRNPRLLIQNGTRFEKIYLPQVNETWRNEIGSYEIYFTPFSNLKDYSSSKELCESVQIELALYDKNLWNNSQVIDPCFRYFCQRNASYQNSLLHYGAQRLCTQCSLTENQNFSASTTCRLFYKDSCDDCSPQSTCIYYDYDFPLCYRSKENRFYRMDDFTHLTLLPMYYEGFPIINLITGILFLISYVFLLVIPNIIYKYYESREKSSLEKMKILFSLPNQTIIIFTFTSILSILGGVADLFATYFLYDIPSINATGFIYSINGNLMIAGIICLIIYWFFLIKIMDFESSISDEYNSIKYVISYALALCTVIIISFLTILTHSLYIFYDQALRKTWIYVFSAVGILQTILYGFIIIVLFILSVKMLFTLSKNEDTKSNFLEIALKLRVRITF